MILIAILFCLALQRFANIGGWFQSSWFEAYLRQLSPWVSKIDERLILFVVIVPILLMFVLIHFIFMWHWFGLFDLIMAILVLFLCIDARDIRSKLKPYFAALEKSDLHAASNAVTDFIDNDAIGNVTELSREVTKAILLKSFEQLFAGLFWFIVFGIYGITTYFLITLLRHNALKVDPNYIGLAKFSAQIQDVLEWLPVRLLGFSYSLVGHFNKGFGYCSKHLLGGLSEVKRFAVDAGLAALDVSPGATDSDKNENLAALDMINRVLIIWLIAIALILIGFLL